MADPTGVKSVDLLLPLILTVTLVTVALLLTIGLAEVEAPTRRESLRFEGGFRDSVAAARARCQR
ncbi:hypothetical protein [Nocardia africana]